MDVDADAHTLTVTVSRFEEKTEGSGQLRRSERFYGSSMRTIRLPRAANLERTQAIASHGVLTISIPKSAAADTSTKSIPIAFAKDEQTAATAAAEAEQLSEKPSG